MLNVLNRADQIFRKLLVFKVSVLVAMTLQRIVLFLLVVRHWVFGSDGTVIGSAFFAGVRFDLCVLGFLNIPVLFIVWVVSTDTLINSGSPAIQSVRRWILWAYLGVMTLLIHVFGLLDLFFFANSGHRWTYADWQAGGFHFFAKMFARWGSLYAIGIVAVFVLLWVFRCLVVLYRVQLHTSPLENPTSGKKMAVVFGGLVLPVVAVAFAARGTWTPHHLGREHSEVSQIEPLNQLALSPLWAFDKTF